jgi:hypothetical protein
VLGQSGLDGQGHPGGDPLGDCPVEPEDDLPAESQAESVDEWRGQSRREAGAESARDWPIEPATEARDDSTVDAAAESRRESRVEAEAEPSNEGPGQPRSDAGIRFRREDADWFRGPGELCAIMSANMVKKKWPSSRAACRYVA